MAHSGPSYRSLDDIAEHHAPRLTTEIEADLRDRGIAACLGRPGDLEEWIAGTLRALAASAPGDRTLPLRLRAARLAGAEPAALGAALVRIAAALRAVALTETTGRRVALQLSAAIDRALCESLAAIDGEPADAPRGGARPGPLRDGTELAVTRLMPAFDRVEPLDQSGPGDARGNATGTATRVDWTARPELLRALAEIAGTPGDGSGGPAVDGQPTAVRDMPLLAGTAATAVHRAMSYDVPAAPSSAAAQAITRGQGAELGSTEESGPDHLRSAAGEARLAEAPEPREPTVVHHVRALLATDTGTLETVTVIAVAFRDGPLSPVDILDGGASSSDLARRRAAFRAILDAIDETGARMVLRHPALVCAALPATGTASEVDRALRLAVRLSTVSDLAPGVGVTRGELLMPRRVVPKTPPAAVGEVLAAAVGLAGRARAGEVLCGPEVGRLAGAAFGLAPLGDDVYRVDPSLVAWQERSRQAGSLGAPGWIGPAATLRAMSSTLRAPHRKVSVIGLRGRAGAGKLTLLRTALDALGVRRERLLIGQSHPLTASPYWPLASIARQVLGLGEEPVAAPELMRRLHELGERSATTASLRAVLPTLQSLIGVSLRDDPTERSLLDDLEPTALRREIAASLRVLLEAAADREPDRPLVVVLRDVREMDAPTAHALAHLLVAYDGAAQLVVVLTYRGKLRMPPQLSAVEVTEIAVGKAPSADLVRIAQVMLDQEELPRGLGSLLDGGCRGSPMMAAVLVRSLVESGALRKDPSGWHGVELPAASAVPHTMRELLGRRLEALPGYLARLIRTAAAVGEVLPRPVLELLWVSGGLAHDEVQQALDLLVDLRWLDREPEGAARFAHPAMRAAAYAQLGANERRDAHRLIAVAYRELYPDALAQMPALIFQHAARAGDRELARLAGVRAAERAAVLRDVRHGLAVVEAALLVCDGDERAEREARFELSCTREHLHEARGHAPEILAERLEDLDAALAIAEELGDARRAGTALHRAARVHVIAGNLRAAATTADGALRRLAGGAPLDVANALRTVALIGWAQGSPDKAAAALEKALVLYESIGHRRGMGFVLHSLGMFALDTGAIEAAGDALTRALAIKDDTGDPRGRAAVLDALGQLALLQGDATIAAERFEQVIALRRDLGDGDGAATAGVGLGEAVLDDEPERAEELARAALALEEGAVGARTRIAAHLLRAAALLRLGRKDQAGRAAATAAELAEKHRARILAVRAGIAVAQSHLAYQGRPRAERAMQAAEAAARTALELGAMRWRIEALAVLATALARLDPDEAARTAREALTAMARRSHAGLDEARIRERCEEVLTAAASSV